VTSVAFSVVGHLTLTAGIALAPALAARDRQPIEFVEVQIVPLQALGVPEPVAPRPQPRQREEPKPAVISESTDTSQAAPADSGPVAPNPPREKPSSNEQAEDENISGPAGAPAQRRGSPLGSAFATSPFGTAVAGFDNPDFVYGYYVEQMLAMIGSNWTRPQAAVDLEMIIHFRIHSDGRLSEIEVVESSGLSSFDLAGRRAVT
jgi:outer membrane biosynthesis protein TonB